MAREAKLIQGFVPTDTTPTSYTIGGESRTPTGAVGWMCGSNTLNSNSNNALWCFGVTDFTTQAFIASSDENAVATTDSSRRGQNDAFLGVMNAGLSTMDRTFTVSAVTGGVQLTPLASGSVYGFFIILFFEVECYSFSAGNGTADTATFNVNYTMINAPTVGILGTCGVGPGAGNDHSALTFGGFTRDSGFQKGVVSTRSRNAQASGTNYGLYSTDKVAQIQSNNAGTLSEIDIDSITNTTATFSNSGTTLPGDLIGLLMDWTGVSVMLEATDSPNSNSTDWTYTVGFQPQLVVMCNTNLPSLDSGVSSDEDAGTFAITAITPEVEYCISLASEQGSSPSDTSSRISNEMYVKDHNSSVDYRMSLPQFTSGGFYYDEINISNADANTHKWLMLSIGVDNVTTGLKPKLSRVSRLEGKII